MYNIHSPSRNPALDFHSPWIISTPPVVILRLIDTPPEFSVYYWKSFVIAVKSIFFLKLHVYDIVWRISSADLPYIFFLFFFRGIRIGAAMYVTHNIRIRLRTVKWGRGVGASTHVDLSRSLFWLEPESV